MSSPLNWKDSEHLVTWLESYVSPDAKVEWNVEMPVIGENRTSQCDVVVRVGTPPRDSFFIVEVQNRNSKVEINEFRGWIQKMDEVGAAGLICVSHAGFPSSVIDSVALKHGPRVKLLTINDEGDPNFTWLELTGSPTLIYEELHLKIPILELPTFLDPDIVPDEVNWTIDGKCFSATGVDADAVTFHQMIMPTLWGNDYIANLPVERCNRWLEAKITVGPGENKSSWLHAKEGTFRIGNWLIPMQIFKEHEEVELEYSKWNYKQQDQGDVVAWFARAEGQMRGRTFANTYIWVPNADGYLTSGMVSVITDPFAAMDLSP